MGAGRMTRRGWLSRAARIASGAAALATGAWTEIGEAGAAMRPDSSTTDPPSGVTRAEAPAEKRAFSDAGEGAPMISGRAGACSSSRERW